MSTTPRQAASLARSFALIAAESAARAARCEALAAEGGVLAPHWAECAVEANAKAADYAARAAALTA